MLSGISIWQLLIVLAIVMMLFGTKRIRHIGSDLGGAFKGFRDAVKESEKGLQAEQDERAPLVSNDMNKQKESVRS